MTKSELAGKILSIENSLGKVNLLMHLFWDTKVHSIDFEIIDEESQNIINALQNLRYKLSCNRTAG